MRLQANLAPSRGRAHTTGEQRVARGHISQLGQGGGPVGIQDVANRVAGYARATVSRTNGAGVPCACRERAHPGDAGVGACQPCRTKRARGDVRCVSRVGRG